MVVQERRDPRGVKEGDLSLEEGIATSASIEAIFSLDVVESDNLV